MGKLLDLNFRENAGFENRLVYAKVEVTSSVINRHTPSANYWQNHLLDYKQALLSSIYILNFKKFFYSFKVDIKKSCNGK
jgi:hypothetical protein